MADAQPDDLFEWALTEALFSTPARLFVTAWTGHIPFLFALIKLVRPRSYVELGVHYGGSFIAACSAARQYGTGMKCFGIDNWQGDQHAGSYDGDREYEKLSAYLKTDFSSATLYRMSFSDALSMFEDGTIDLLHLDGLHTFSAVQHDFESWKQKLSPQGIALFHDISMREDEFGVWKLWENLKRCYPSMEFFHAQGLGVAFVGGDQIPAAQRLLDLWNTNPPFREFFRTTCEHLGRTLPERMHPKSVVALKLLTQDCRTWKLLWPLVRFSRTFRWVNSIGRQIEHIARPKLC